MPLRVERRDDVFEKAGLDLRDAGGVPVAQRRHREIQAALVIALPEELLADLVGPLPRYIPRSTRIGDVCALEGDLQDEVAILGPLHLERIVAQVILR